MLYRLGDDSSSGEEFVIKSATPTSIHQLFSHEQNVHYFVPKYQREYSWGKEQWSALFSDLMEDDALAGHFLGTIIGVDRSEAVLGSRVLEVVDGQQRITTVTLLLAAIYSELVARREEVTSDDELSDLTNLKRMLVTGDPLVPRVRLQIQNDNEADFLSVLADCGIDIDGANVKWSGNRKIKKAFRFFRSCLMDRIESESSRATETLFDVLNRAKKAILVSLEVQSQADAFVLFESLNNRGLALTPIDLIKNAMLERADSTLGLGVDKAYSRWTKWMSNLGGEYRDQERFFRQFYNAFKTQWGLTIPNIPVATRSKLITIFEEMLKGDFETFSDRMDRATSAYKLILGLDENASTLDGLRSALLDLSRVEGAPSYILVLHLLVNREVYGLEESELAEIVRILIRFFVRRNLTNTPPTYALDRLFISLVEKWNEEEGIPAREKLVRQLQAVSVSDEEFLSRLNGPIYEENAGITRFILIQLAQVHMNNEKWTDLWARVKVGESKEQYRWTIEHIVPQGENMPAHWIEMLGGSAEAERVLNEDVHRLGNLTITGYNSSLGNLSFTDKRDRRDTKAPHDYVGYKNGLELNEDLCNRNEWKSSDIIERTRRLATSASLLFSLE